MFRISQRLTNRQDPNVSVNFIWLTDEKLFTVAALNNNQHDHIYVSAGTRRRDILANCLLCSCSTFSESLIHSFIEEFVKHPLKKFNQRQYLWYQLGYLHLIVWTSISLNLVLRSMNNIPRCSTNARHFTTLSWDDGAFHSCTLLSYCKLRHLFSSAHLVATNSPDLNPVHYKIWSVVQERCIDIESTMVAYLWSFSQQQQPFLNHGDHTLQHDIRIQRHHFLTKYLKVIEKHPLIIQCL